MKLNRLMVVAAAATIVSCVSVRQFRLGDRIVGTWQQIRVEGPAVAEYTNAVRFAEMTFRKDGTYQTRAGKSAVTAFCASGTYTCVSSQVEMLSTAGDRKRLYANIDDEKLVLTDGTNTAWLIRSTR